jgi:hypothetical protein
MLLAYLLRFFDEGDKHRVGLVQVRPQLGGLSIAIQM